MDQLWAELQRHHTLGLAGFSLVAALVVQRAARDERRGLIGSFVLLGVHLVAVGLAAVLGQHHVLHGDASVLALGAGGLAFVWLAGSLFFGRLLPLVGVKTPRILRDVLLAVASIVVLLSVGRRAGLNVSGIIATSAVATAVIGFALQDTLGNVMGGLALQLDRSISVGEWIRMGDTFGRVVEISWRHTAVETPNGETVLVPNALLGKSQVTVVGRRRGRSGQWRRRIDFRASFKVSPARITEAVEASLRAQLPSVSAEHPPTCTCVELGENHARYQVRYWLTELGRFVSVDGLVRTRIYFTLSRLEALWTPPTPLRVQEETEADRQSERQTERNRRAAVLASVELFADLPWDDLLVLAEELHPMPYARGEVVMQEGAEGHSVYVLASGKVAVKVAVGDAKEKVAEIAAPSFFGEMSLLTGAPRAATVIAQSELECYELDKLGFQRLVQRSEVAEAVAAAVARRQLELQQARDSAEGDSAATFAAAQGVLVARIRRFFGLDGAKR